MPANNFNLLRFAAALMVMLFHLSLFGFITGNPSHAVQAFFSFFPGVPVFFIVSGFLISGSWLKNPHFKSYVRNRILRIYPALFLAVILSVLLLMAFGFWQQVSLLQALRWAAMQASGYFTYHTPKPFEAFTGGLVNGNLWTIGVELTFYLVLPLILRKSRRRATLVLVAMMATCWALQMFNDFGWHHHPDLRHGLLHNFWWLGCGVLGRLRWDNLKAFLPDLPSLLLLHAGVCLVWVVWCYQGGIVAGGSMWLTPSLLPLVLAFAHAKPMALQHWLGDVDISYGLYLLHPLAIHIALRSDMGIPWIVVFTFSAAYLSWKFIEQPLLHLKR